MRAEAPKLEDLGASLERLAPAVVRGGIVAGVVGLGGAVITAVAGPGGLSRLYPSWLCGFSFWLTVTLGALFFTIIQHLVRAGWSVVVRRLAEAMSSNLPLMALLFVPLLFGLRELYPWARPEAVQQSELLQHKAGWLNPAFFAGRWAVYFLLWSWLAYYFWRRSTAQDRAGSPDAVVSIHKRMERWAAPSMILYAVTLNFASFDLLMSLSPEWYSTIFGVYTFSGGLVGFLALFSIAVALLQRSGRMRGVTDEHWHDLGKLVFAFTVFWAYIAFSQYMLIWYANIPEETVWFRPRLQGAWQPLSILLLFGHFWIPFFLLLPRFVKRTPKLLGPIAAWVAIMHFVDIYWLVMPAISPDRMAPHPADLLVVLGMGGFWVAATAHRLRRVSLVPARDPRLAESLTFENA